MARKPKPAKLSAAKLVRAMARARIGPVPASRRVEDKRAKPPRHKLGGRRLEVE